MKRMLGFALFCFAMGMLVMIVIHNRNIYPLIHAIYYVDTVEIVEIEKQYKQECV